MFTTFHHFHHIHHFIIIFTKYPLNFTFLRYFSFDSTSFLPFHLDFSKYKTKFNKI